MRIIAGQWGGRAITAPKGRDTRPTSDRVREALFSMLTSHFGTWDEVIALDAYAGSGALGLEALSRGAEHVTFVEKDPRALAALRDNITGLSAHARSTVIAGDVLVAVKSGRVSPNLSLLLLDPPYRINKSEVRGLIEALAEDEMLPEGSVLVWEHASGDAVDWPSFVIVRHSRRYGSTTLDIGIAHLSRETR